MSTTNLPPAVTHTASLLPKLVTTLREGYGLAAFRADFPAGLTVAVVALPLSMAIAIASGAKPEQGLISAVIGGFIVWALALLRLGTLIQRIPHEAVFGFTAAIAVIILASQLRDFFGLKLTGEPGPAISAQRHQSGHLLQKRPRQNRRKPQHPSPQMPGFPNPERRV